MTASNCSFRLLFLFTLWTSPALFAGGVVTNCTEVDLRAAMSGGGTVTFACGGTISLTGTIRVTKPTVIDAAGWAVTIRGSPGYLIFEVTQASTFQLRGITLTGGGAFVDRTWGAGVHIARSTTLVLERCTFRNHMGSYGAAVYLENDGRLRANGCEFFDNQAIGGAAVGLGFRTRVGITNCTFYNNSSLSRQNPASTSVVFGRTGASDVVFVHCTITRNTSGQRENGLTFPAINTGTFYNCILSENVGGNVENSGLESIGNLSDDLSGTFPVPGNLVNVDPLLEGPISYEGKTLGFRLQPGSPALGGGSLEFCHAEDQRGLPRPRGTGCDIGAWEMQPPMGPPVVGTGVADLELIASRTAILEGSVDPAGYETWVHFEYGINTSLASRTEAISVESNAFSTPVSMGIDGLRPGFEYSYRTVATNSAGRAEGEIRSFYVAAPLLDCTEAVLRQALASSDMVRFQCGGTITLEETLVIDHDVTLDGTGAGTTISGQGLHRLFILQQDVTLTLRGLNLVDGHALGEDGGSGTPTLPGQPGLGGCILNLGGRVILEDCLLARHVAKGGRGGTSSANEAPGGDGYGGALCNQGGQMTVNRCMFEDNQVIGGLGSIDPGCLVGAGDSGHAIGGAIYSNHGVVEVNDSTFVKNTATGGAPQFACLDFYSRGGNAAGGAIGAITSTLILHGSILATNSATTAPCPWSGEGTGAAQGGALFLGANGEASVHESSFLGNSTESGGVSRYAPVGNANGGAIFNDGTLRLSDSLLTGNQCVAGRGNEGAQADGGALSSAGRLTITGSTFDQNTARGSAGLAVSSFPMHGFDGAGGALWSGGVLTLTNSTFTANLAQGGDGRADIGPGEDHGGAGWGGALQIGGGTAVLVNLTIANNQALGGAVDGRPGAPLGASSGAGVGVSMGSSVEIMNTILANNSPGGNVFGSVTDGGFNISSDDTPLLAGARSLNNTDAKLGLLGDNGGPTPTMALLIGSPAFDAGSTEFCPKRDQRDFPRPVGLGCDIGALEMQPSPSGLLDCTEAALRQALALTNEVIFQCDGVITLAETLVIDRDVTLDATGAEASISGQGVRRLFVVQPGVTLTLRGLDLVDGLALGESGGPEPPTRPGQPGKGGCILNLGGRVILEDCFLSGHRAEGGEGGSSGQSRARGGEGYGGAISNQGGEVIIDRCVFINNDAVGGLGSGDPQASNTNGDSGHAMGGAIYCETGLVTVSASTFVENTATGGKPQFSPLFDHSLGGNAVGGAIAATDSTCRLETSVFLTNSVATLRSEWSGRGVGSASGGAVYLDNGTVSTIQLSTFAGNSATGGGSPRFAPGGMVSGGALFNAGRAAVIDSTFTGNHITGGSSIPPGPARGGALASAGSLAISGCTLNLNRSQAGDVASVASGGPATNGIGGAVWSSAQLAVTNSTFVANMAIGGDGSSGIGGGPGGAGIGGALGVEGGAAILVNVTLAENLVEGGRTDGDALGGALGNINGVIEIANTLLALNGVRSARVLLQNNAWGTVIDGGYNISSDDTPPLTATGSLNNTDPLLGTLSDNGGPTLTMALLAGSPALDAIPSAAPPADQRGVSRPQGTGADIGAYEAALLLHIAMNNTEIVITFDAKAGHTYDLLRSAYMVDWERVDSQTAETSSQLQFTQPLLEGISVLYRIASD